MTADEDEFDFTGHRVLLAEDNELNRELRRVIGHGAYGRGYNRGWTAGG